MRCLNTVRRNRCSVWVGSQASASPARNPTAYAARRTQSAPRYGPATHTQDTQRTPRSAQPGALRCAPGQALEVPTACREERPREACCLGRSGWAGAERVLERRKEVQIALSGLRFEAPLPVISAAGARDVDALPSLVIGRLLAAWAVWIEASYLLGREITQAVAVSGQRIHPGEDPGPIVVERLTPSLVL
jgi:hypothetical protein